LSFLFFTKCVLHEFSSLPVLALQEMTMDMAAAQAVFSLSFRHGAGIGCVIPLCGLLY